MRTDCLGLDYLLSPIISSWILSPTSAYEGTGPLPINIVLGVRLGLDLRSSGSLPGQWIPPDDLLT